jgi:hypothetical protein
MATSQAPDGSLLTGVCPTVVRDGEPCTVDSTCDTFAECFGGNAPCSTKSCANDVGYALLGERGTEACRCQTIRLLSQLKDPGGGLTITCRREACYRTAP